MPQKKPTKAEIKKKESLKHKPALVWDSLTDKERKQAFALAEDYKCFLDAAKTEREAVREIVGRALKAGYKEPGGKTRPTKVFQTRYGKVGALALVGDAPLTDGLRLIVSHVDAPRLDLKPRPLYEDLDLAFLKTHYYGGIKKYQWLSRPLALHGFVVKDDGRRVDLVVGEDDGDPRADHLRPAAAPGPQRPGGQEGFRGLSRGKAQPGGRFVALGAGRRR